MAGRPKRRERLRAAGEEVPVGDKPPTGGSWLPFEPGNEAARTHGADSLTVLDEATERAKQILESAPERTDLREPSVWPSVLDLAIAETRAKRVSEYLEAVPLADQMRSPRGGGKAKIELLTSLEKRAADLRKELGLTPMSSVRLRQMTSSTRATDVMALTAGVRGHRDSGAELVAAHRERRALNAVPTVDVEDLGDEAADGDGGPPDAA